MGVIHPHTNNGPFAYSLNPALGGCGQSFDIKIVSKDFEGVGTLARHRMVNNALKDEISCLHAFSQVRKRQRGPFFFFFFSAFSSRSID